MVAVTGTNGKTSCASFTRQIWEALGVTAVSFGTVGRRGRGRRPAQPHHTGTDRAARAARRAGGKGRDPRGDGGVLPRARPAPAGRGAAGGGGLHQHHPRPPRLPLDFEAYLAAKLGLFERVLPRGATAVINLDDPAGARVRAVAEARGQRVLAVGRAEGSELRLIGQRFDATGQELLFAWGGRSHRARLDLIGGFQAMNALVAAGLAIGSGSEAARGDRGAAGAPDRARPHGARCDPCQRRGGLRRLCPHAGRTDDRADRAAPACARPAAGGLRRRRRPRPRQAAADGRGGGGGGGRRLRHRRQPPHRGRRRDPRGGAGRRPRGDRDRRPRRGDPDRGRRAATRATRS